MDFLMTLLGVFGGLVLLLGLVVVATVRLSPNRISNPEKPARRLRTPPLYRPVRRYKSKMRGIGVGVKVKESVDNINGQLVRNLVGVDRRNYVRFYPNFGFTFFGYHWCRKGKHDGPGR